MGSKKDTTYYMELQPGDAVQDGDQWLDWFGQWQPYVCNDQISGVVFSGVRVRRPIGTTNQTAYEEVPGSRTTQGAASQPQRERIAYEELQPGDKIQPGDEWKNGDGRWQPYVCLTGLLQFVQDRHMARRPYKISAIHEIGDSLANAQKAATQLQGERDELRESLAAEQRAHKCTMTSGLQACSERDEACRERDLARSEVARLSTELWARKPLEDRVASLTEELAQAREANRQLLQTITDNADQFALDGYNLQHERDEARAELQRLQEVVTNLYNEATARQVQEMLRTWATELDWSAGCFDSVGRDKVSAVQRVLVAVVERIEGLINPEGGSDDN